jgi:hypothetical protein
MPIAASRADRLPLGSDKATPNRKDHIMASMTFEEALEVVKGMGIPDAGLKPLQDKWAETEKMILLNNERIVKINAAKAQDPTKPGYADELDKLWAVHAPQDSEMSEKEKEYQAITAKAEKLLKELREFAKTKVTPPLSEKENADLRKAVNDGKPAIDSAREGIKAMATMVDGILTAAGKPIEGGLVSLLPEADSLKSLRGRKASGGSSTSYMTRIGDGMVNGTSIAKDGKANFHAVADKVSELFGAGQFPANKVTGEEVETEFYKAIGKDFRSMKTVKTPDAPQVSEFDFTKEVTTGENTTETRTVKISIVAKESEAKTESEKPADNKSDNTPAVKNEGETEKVDAEKVPAQEVPAPAKKATAAKPANK